MPNTTTPWGPAQTERSIAPGLTSYTTAGHGGIHVSVGRNREVHAAWRNPEGWYEEDLEANIVVYSFPEAFSNEQVAYALKQLRTSLPHQFMAVTGEVLTAADSHVLRREEFEAASRDQFVVRSAFGSQPVAEPRSELPAGTVGVLAERAATKEVGWFLVPREEYAARPKDGTSFIVDPDRHPVWPPIERAPASRGGR